MSQIKGTNVGSPVVPFDTADQNPSHEARYGKGGYRTVATLEERDAIPVPRLEAGMLVYVEEDGKAYQLDGDLVTWTEFTSGDSLPAGTEGDVLTYSGGVWTAAAPSGNFVSLAGSAMDTDASITFSDGTSDSEIAGWGFGVETNGGNEYATVTATGIVVHGTSSSTTINPSNVYFSNGTSLAVGTFDLVGGYNGISLNCAVGYELNWQAGHLKATADNGATAANILCDSPIEFPGAGTDNVQIDAAGVTFADGTQQTTAWVGVPADSVGTSALQAASVTTAKLGNGVVTSAKLANSLSVYLMQAQTLIADNGGASSTALKVSASAFGITVDSFAVSGTGTVTAGVWNGTAVGLAYGGTGATTAAGARTALGLGTAATAASSSFAAASHTHDDRYYTETETDALLAGKQASGSYAAATHTHAAGDVTSGTFDIARIPTGTTSTTVSLGDHTHSQLHDRSHAITSTSDHTAGNWKVLYSNGSGNVTELALGASGSALVSNGTSSAPSFTALAASATTDTTSASNISSGTLAAARIGTHATTHNPGGSDAVSLVEYYEFTRSTKPADATGSNGAYTWTPPANCKAVEFLIIAPGGGGGSGRRGAAGSARYGGGGGAGGNIIQHVMRRSVITTALTVNVAAGGGGGNAVTADDTNGNPGTTAGQSSVLFNGASFTLMATGGGGGGGGSTSAGSAGTAQSGYSYTFLGSIGGASSVSANGQSGSNAQSVGGLRLTGGSAGGGISTGNTAYNGGSYTVAANVALAGMVDFPSGTASGGNASTSAAGGTGADGISYGFGGSGGGASANGNSSGKGGNGGDGFVRITCWY